MSSSVNAFVSTGASSTRGSEPASEAAAARTYPDSTHAFMYFMLSVARCLARCSALVRSLLWSTRRHCLSRAKPSPSWNASWALVHPRRRHESANKALTRALTSVFSFDASSSAVDDSAASVGGASVPSPAAMRSSGPIASHPSAASCAFGWFCTVVPSTSAAAARSLACGEEATYRTSGSTPPSVCRSPPLSTPLTRSHSSSISVTLASISSTSCVASMPVPMQVKMSFMRLISSTNPLAIASSNHFLSSSEISRAGGAPDVPSPCCAMDHFRMAFQLDLSAGAIDPDGSSLMADGPRV